MPKVHHKTFISAIIFESNESYDEVRVYHNGEGLPTREYLATYSSIRRLMSLAKHPANLIQFGWSFYADHFQIHIAHGYDWARN